MNVQKLIFFLIFLNQYQCTSSAQEQTASDNDVKIEVSDSVKGNTKIKKDNKKSRIPYLSIYKDSIPFRFLSRKEQVEKSEPIHVYNNYQLKRSNHTPQQYRFLDQEQGIEIVEQYPGIIDYSYRTPMVNEEELTIPLDKRKEKIEFYDKITGELLNTRVVDEENPYINKGIIKGSPYGEYHEAEGVFVSNFKSKADEFYTSGQAYTLPNGYAYMKYWNYAIKGKYVLGIEMSFIIYDFKGKTIKQINSLPYRITSLQITDDGRYVLLLGRDYFSNVMNEEGEDVFRIYDLKSMNIIHEFKPTDGARLGGISQIENGFFRLSSNRKKDTARIESFFDFKHRIKYSKELLGEDRKNAFKDFVSYSNLLERIKFNQEEF